MATTVDDIRPDLVGWHPVIGSGDPDSPTPEAENAVVGFANDAGRHHVCLLDADGHITDLRERTSEQIENAIEGGGGSYDISVNIE